MGRPQVADGGTASSSCEYIEKIVADFPKGVFLQLGGWTRCQQLLTLKTYLVTKYSCSKPQSWTNILYNLSNKMWHEISYVDVRSLRKAGSLIAAARKVVRYKFDSVDVQEVR